MDNGVVQLIETWFAEHDNDGDFASGISTLPYSVIGPTIDGGRVIFATKQRVVSTIVDERKVSDEFGMIARYGLPGETDLHWIRKLIGPRELLFLGDMDPVDLMVFAWLRARLRPKHVIHIGVNDALLAALRISSTKTLSIPCGPSEQQSLALLKKVLPDLRKTVGTNCAQMLERGAKIELDGIGRDRKHRVAIARVVGAMCKE